MLPALALVEPAYELRRYLDSGGLLTPWAEKMCGQKVFADVARTSPLRLYREEARSMDVSENENWAALRRGGELVQADGTKVGRVTSVVPLARVGPEVARVLQTTRTPLGTALGPEAWSKVLWCTVNITEFAVACGRLILVGDKVMATTTDWVLWSWLGQITREMSTHEG